MMYYFNQDIERFNMWNIWKKQQEKDRKKEENQTQAEKKRKQRNRIRKTTYGDS